MFVSIEFDKYTSAATNLFISAFVYAVLMLNSHFWAISDEIINS
jgi:hypothetical protein